MRRQLTEERKRLHKNTHNWSRKRYRKIIQGHVTQGREVHRGTRQLRHLR